MHATFDDSLVTGNNLIDSQHMELIGKINKLVDCCEEGRGKIEAIKMLDYLAEYTEFHFSAEEDLQEKINYPGLAEHRQKHEEFKKSVSELYAMLDEQEGPTDAFVEKVKEKVVDWILYHIKTFDRSVAEYIMMQDNPQLYN